MKILTLPNMLQSLLMEHCPLLHQIKCFCWQISLKHLKSFQINHANIFPINCVKMRWIMLSRQKIHFDNNTVKSGNDWHSDSSFIG